MTEKLSRFWRWFNTASVPMIYVTYFLLILSIAVVIGAVVQDNFGVTFWAGMALFLWNVYDAVKYHVKKRRYRQEVNPE